MIEDDIPAPVRAHQIGEDLSTLSAEEIGARIASLRAEIARLEAELSSKDASKAAADAFFRR